MEGKMKHAMQGRASDAFDILAVGDPSHEKITSFDGDENADQSKHCHTKTHGQHTQQRHQENRGTCILLVRIPFLSRL